MPKKIDMQKSSNCERHGIAKTDPESVSPDLTAKRLSWNSEPKRRLTLLPIPCWIYWIRSTMTRMTKPSSAGESYQPTPAVPSQITTRLLLWRACRVSQSCIHVKATEV